MLLSAAPAAAHLQYPRLTGERSIDIALNEHPIRIRYRIGLGARLADAERGRADTDDQFGVSAAEGNAALDAHTDALLAKLSVCTGRTLEQVSCRALTHRDVEQVEAQGWVPGASRDLHFAWTLRLREDAAEIGALRLSDDYRPAGIEITNVQITPPQGVKLLRAGDAAQSSAEVMSLLSENEKARALGPRVVVAAWPPPPATDFRIWLVLAALVVIGVIAARWRRSI